MSVDTIRLRIRIGENEVEIEGSLPIIKEAQVMIADLIKSLPLPSNIPTVISTQVQSIKQSMPTSIETTLTQTRSIPEIKVEKTDSLSDIILKMFKNSWGRQPQKLNNVREALSSYGLIYPKQSVAVALLRLAQSSKLRRFKDGSEYVYTASTGLSDPVGEMGQR